MPENNEKQLERELALRKYVHTSGLIAGTINNIARWTGLVAIAMFAYLCIRSLSGERTNAQIGISILGDVRISEVFAWLLAGSGMAYGRRQRSLRRRAIEHLHPRSKRYEESVDRGRSSSQLTPRGDTRPEDKI